MKRCPHCEHPIEDGARFCVYCANSLDEKKIWAPRRRRPRLYRAVALACVAALTVSAVWLWPRESLPLSDAPAVSTPVAGTPGPDGGIESDASDTAAPSSGAGSTTLADMNSSSSTETNSTTAAENGTSTTPKNPTPSSTTALPSSATNPITTGTTLPPRPTTLNPDRTPIETPPGIAQMEGRTIIFRDTDMYDTYYNYDYVEDRYEYAKLQIDIVSISCFLAQNPRDASDTQHPYVEITAWLPPSDYKLTSNSRLRFKVVHPDTRSASYHTDNSHSFSEVLPGNYTTLIVDAYTKSLGNLLEYEWSIDGWGSPIDYRDL